jgi:hypothetical protein
VAGGAGKTLKPFSSTKDAKKGKEELYPGIAQINANERLAVIRD